MTTVLELLRDVTEKMGLPTPGALIGAQDNAVKQYRGIFQELIQELGEYRWTEQRLRRTFTSVAGTGQGTLISLFGSGYDGLVPDTMWNETRQMRIFGPMTDERWAALKVLPNGGPEFEYWINSGQLYLTPTQVGGETISAIYISKFSVVSETGDPKARITADSDTLLFPDLVVKKGLEWKWRKQKGESGWQADYNDWIGLVAKNVVKNTGARLNLSSPTSDVRPGIIIPSGSWNV